MTVCLGIMVPADKAVVVAADRMVTRGRPEVEFEHEGSKIEMLAPTCVALAAGDALVARNLFADVRLRLQESDDQSIAHIASTMRDVFVQHRLARAEDLHLRGRGVTVGEFYEHYLDRWPQELVAGLDGQIQSTQLNITVLIAGVDDQPHLYVVEDPGLASCWDDLGFCAIGSGTPLATLHWIAKCSGPAPSVPEGVYIAHEAKLRSEAHPGVGQNTDMALVRPSRLVELPPDCLERLRAQQQRAAASPLPDMTQLQGQLRLLLEEQTGGETRG